MSTAYEKNCNESRKTGTLGSYIYNLKDNVEIKMPVTNRNKILLEKNDLVQEELVWFKNSLSYAIYKL